MKLIPLTKGYFAKVDDDDFEKFATVRWCATVHKHHIRAIRTVYKEEGKGRKEKGVYLHREIMEAKPGQYVDHINGDTLDNRKCNLRFCTLQENTFNRKSKEGSSCDYKGVCYRPRKKMWTCSICANGEKIHLGYFRDPVTAAHVYDAKAKELHGEFARLNFPQSQVKFAQKEEAM